MHNDPQIADPLSFVGNKFRKDFVFHKLYFVTGFSPFVYINVYLVQTKVRFHLKSRFWWPY